MGLFKMTLRAKTSAYINGNHIYEDDSFIKRYDDGSLFDRKDARPCPKCGQKQTGEMHDYCIKNLGNVVNACCGHGVEKGYIMFDSGITIRGIFTIEENKLGNLLVEKKG